MNRTNTSNPKSRLEIHDQVMWLHRQYMLETQGWSSPAPVSSSSAQWGHTDWPSLTWHTAAHLRDEDILLWPTFYQWWLTSSWGFVVFWNHSHYIVWWWCLILLPIFCFVCVYVVSFLFVCLFACWLFVSLFVCSFVHCVACELVLSHFLPIQSVGEWVSLVVQTHNEILCCVCFLFILTWKIAVIQGKV